MSQAVPASKKRSPRISHVLESLARFAKLSLLIVLVAGAGAGGWALYGHYDVPVAVIGIKGELGQVSKAEVEQGVANNLGGGFLSLDLVNICRSLEEHPWIARASARRKWPDEIIITIEEERPIARWGEEQFLNNQGQVIDVANGVLPEGLPLLYGPEGKERRVMQQYRNFSQVLQPIGLNVKSCVLERRGWQLDFDNGLKLAVGKEPVAEKMDRFVRVWNLALKQRLDEVAQVDIRYGNGVAVQWIKESERTGQLTANLLGDS